MSDGELETADDDPGLVTRAYRTVTPGYRGRGDAEMNAIGWGLFLGILVLFLPLLPFVAIVWAISKVTESLAGRGGE